MANHDISNSLATTHYVTAVLRLTVDGRGKLLHGEVLDVSGGLRQTFDGWRGLTIALRAWLSKSQPSK